MAIALASIGLQAQSTAGTFTVTPRVGGVLSNITKESSIFTGAGRKSKSKSKLGFLAGGEVQYQATPMVGVSLGAYFQRMGCNYDNTDLTGVDAGTYTVLRNIYTNLDYVSVPLLAHVYVANNLSIDLGLQCAFLVSVKRHSEMSSVTVGKDGSYTYDRDYYKINTSIDAAKKVDFSIPVGISYEYQNVVVGAHYQFGLSKVYKAPLDNGNRNRGFIFSAGYRFNVGSI